MSHCFTCSNDTLTSFRVSRGLAAQGVGVLRFDLTGLGDSGGEFADSNFTTMVEDIVSAADFLQREYTAPVALIGHSMGGTASLLAARRIDTCKTVVTLASPSQPDHVLHHFGPALARLTAGDNASIRVAGTDYPVKPQFVEDVKQYDMTRLMAGCNTAILAVRAGRDTLVPAADADAILRLSTGRSELLELAEADHLFSERSQIDNIVEHILAFI
jgi:putative redox protein